MTLDATARKVATNLINQFGRSITLTTVTPGAYNPSTGLATPTTVDAAIKGVVEEYKGFEIAADMAQAGDKKVTVAASPLASRPSPNDKLRIDTFVYTIVGVKAISSGELNAIYELQARLM